MKRVVGLLPTYNRPAMAHRAAHLWLEQDYAGPKTLLVFDDGEDPATFCPSCEPHIKIVHHARTTLPHKRNAMMGLVGDEDAIYFAWDDDDYHGPGRVRRQVEALMGAPSGVGACLMSPMLYYNEVSGELKLSTWRSDGNIAYTFDYWNRRNYDERVDPGSGWRFLAGRDHEIVAIAGELDCITVAHAGQRHTPPAFGLPDFTDAPVSAEWAAERLRLR